MASRPARKTCSQCGTVCLQDEILCWACGALFVTRSGGITSGAAEPTLVGPGGGAAPVGSARAGRRGRMRRYLPWITVGALSMSAGVALRLTAFWYETQATRADSSNVSPLQVETARVPPTASVPAPPLGAELPPVGEGFSEPISGSAPGVAARRPRTNRPRPTPGFALPRTVERPASDERPAADAHPVPSGGVRPPAPTPHPPGPAPHASTPALHPPPPPAGRASTAPPFAGSAAVVLRNDTSSALDFEFGPGQPAGTVAPYSRIAVPLPGGDYDLTLRSPGRNETLDDVRVERGHTYQVTFDGRRARVAEE